MPFEPTGATQWLVFGTSALAFFGALGAAVRYAVRRWLLPTYRIIRRATYAVLAIEREVMNGHDPTAADYRPLRKQVEDLATQVGGATTKLDEHLEWSRKKDEQLDELRALMGHGGEA